MPNRWTTFVRDFANRHNMTYPCAMSDVDCKAQYKDKYGNRKNIPKKQQKEMMGMEDIQSQKENTQYKNQLKENIKMTMEDVNVVKKPKKKKNIKLVIEEEEEEPAKRGRKQKYATDEERKEAKRIQTIASNKKRYAEKKAEKEGSGINDTYRNKFNRKYGYDKNESHSIQDIANITDYNIDGLKTIYDKGIGAYKTNPSSVRPQVKSAEQWAMARIYSAVMGGKAMKVDKAHLIKGDGILQDISKGIKKVGSKVNKGLQTAVDFTEKTANKAYEGAKDVAKDINKYGKAVIYGRMDYPPKVRKILKQYGEEIITSYKIKRTPVSSLLTSALSAVSLGSFGKRFGRSEYDELFHLFLEMTTQSGKKISVEKNEVINMEVSPPSRPKEEVKDITSNIPSGLTINELMNKTEERMGKTEFYGYSARDNNCQDFIVSVLKANDIGDETDQKFVKQDTKSLFENLTFLRKFSNTLTTIGARANVITTGAGYNEKNGKNIISHNSIRMPKFVKGSQEAKDHMASIRANRGVRGQGTPLLDQKFSVNDVISTFGGKKSKKKIADDKFSVNEAGKFFKKDVKKLFGGSVCGSGYGGGMCGSGMSDFRPHLIGGDKGIRHMDGGAMMSGVIHPPMNPVEMGRPQYAKGLLQNQVVCPHCETSMSGGKINIGKAFRDLGKTIDRGFKKEVIKPTEKAFQPVVKVGKDVGKYITSKKGGLATDLIKYGIPAASGATLGGLATLATGGNPVAGVAASALGSKLGAMGAKELQKATGTGMRKGRFVKGSQEAKDYMASIRKRKN